MSDQQTIPGRHPATATRHLFPVFLKTERLHLLIIGGGTTAWDQLQELWQNGLQPEITVVSEDSIPEIKHLAGTNAIKLLERTYNNDDLLNTDLVIITVNDPEIAGLISGDIRHAGKLASIAGQPEQSDFYFGLPTTDITAGQPDAFLPALPPDETIGRQHGWRPLTGNSTRIIPAAANSKKNGKELSYKRIATRALLVFAVMLIGHFLFSYLPYTAIETGLGQLYQAFDQSFLIMLLAGFVAQLVDGALGMGYGVTSATILLSAGVSPAAISGSIHTAEMFASGASGYSHYRFGNVNKKLFRTLLIPGVAGAILGAVLLVYLGEKYGSWIRPLLACYTLFLGIKILSNAFRDRIRKKKYKHYKALAGAGGFFDSFGGGGWGPIVTTTLITKGRSPKYVIGSVSLTEFFVTLSSAFTFFILLGVSHWQTILGLIIGGLIAAPVAAKLTGKLPRKTAFILLGVLVIIWSLKILAGLFR
ncbi:TSUP family transporter [Niabella aurantiaca]|uniref:TSUP family transporter n=1 Tax=Niabella aurantiaca TaxID=379900 RepID=UPI0003713E07|nr:TSUP family transporter [Niabella aurantiaca]